MTAERYDAAIIGGGAAGLAAAIAFQKKNNNRSLVLIDANETFGKKLLATGNGRCNISNLSADGYQKTKEFFRSIGVLFRVEDGGRVYPMSGRADSVVDALVCAISRDSTELLAGARVSQVDKAIDAEVGESGFNISLEEQEQTFFAKRLLIATGGKAGPHFGCYGDGFAFARALGHGVESIRPALVPITYTEPERERLTALKGVRIKSRAELYIDGRRAASSSGELQFTDYGLSGVMIFDISTMMPKSILEGKPRTEIVLDFAPGEEAGELERLIRENEGLWLEGVVPKKLSELLVREGGGDAAKVAELAKNFVVSVGGTKGWKEAQATLGGVRTSEIDEKTGESLIVKGLFFAGETLEPVYICGGYNLNHAWATGIRAGENL